MEKVLSPGLSRQWRQYTHDVSDPPSVEHLLAFIERQKKFAPDHRLTALKGKRQQKQKTQTNRNTVLQAQESLKSQEPNKAKCPYCGQQHNIFACSGFKTLSVQALNDGLGCCVLDLNEWLF